MEDIKTRHRKPDLYEFIHEGYRFIYKSSQGNSDYWECEMLRTYPSCRCRLRTIGSCIVSKPHAHNHSPDPSLVTRAGNPKQRPEPMVKAVTSRNTDPQPSTSGFKRLFTIDAIMGALDSTEKAKLVNAAIEVLPNAYNVYSKFPVGAALLTKCGKIFVGVNVENASYGGTICAERSALVSAVTAGFREFKGLAVVTQLKDGGSPCGICRQFLVEFGDFPVLLASTDGQLHLETSVSELLPHAFTPHSLEEHRKQ